jgi:hypothetical protein
MIFAVMQLSLVAQKSWQRGLPLAFQLMCKAFNFGLCSHKPFAPGFRFEQKFSRQRNWYKNDWSKNQVSKVVQANAKRRRKTSQSNIVASFAMCVSTRSATFLVTLLP